MEIPGDAQFQFRSPILNRGTTYPNPADLSHLCICARRFLRIRPERRSSVAVDRRRGSLRRAPSRSDAAFVESRVMEMPKEILRLMAQGNVTRILPPVLLGL